MSSPLVPGQNAPLQHRRLRFRASSVTPLDVSALVVDARLQAMSSDEFVFYNQPASSGVRLESDCLAIDLEQVRADAHGVLCLVSVDPAAAQRSAFTALSATLTDERNGDIVEFAIPLRGGETAVICFELYRRQGDWKVRAVGQGYAGGLGQLIFTHGVEVDDPTPPAAPATATAAAQPLTMPATTPSIQPLDRSRSFDRMWMIFEDAARSAAAFVSARDYATKRLDDELTAAVADPSMRNSQAGNEARAVAQKRHDDVVTTAQRTYQHDSDHLIRELATIDPQLPRPLASWDSPAWLIQSSDTEPSDGIRIGTLSAADRGPLEVPFCVRLPLQRPLWIDSETPLAAAPVVASYVLRLLAANSPTPILDVVDLTGSLDKVTAPLERLITSGVVRSHLDISARLESISGAVELAEMAVSNGLADLAPPARVVVLSDFAAGYGAEDISKIIHLASVGPAFGLSLVIIGGDESRSTDQQLVALSRHCQHIPVSGQLRMYDPWTENEWEFTPDSVTADESRLARVLSQLDR